jgi:hypothetical protein
MDELLAAVVREDDHSLLVVEGQEAVRGDDPALLVETARGRCAPRPLAFLGCLDGPGPWRWTARPWEAEMAGALDGHPGVVIHSGLRAASLAVNADGHALRVNQGDDLLGEEGSALWLATRALRMAVQARAGRMQPSERLEDALMRSFGADDLGHLVTRFEEGAIDRAEMAGFVSTLLHLARYPDPDPACRALFLQASRHLAGLVRVAVEKAFTGSPLAAAEGGPSGALRGSWGGAAMHPPLTEIFVEDMERYVPGIDWRAPVAGRAVGALMLARALARTRPGGGAVGPETWRELFATRRSRGVDG